MRTQTIIFASFTALVAGVAIGILTAPCKGKATQKKVMDSADNLRKVILGFRKKTGHSVEDVKELLTQEIEGLEPAVKAQILQIIESSRQKNLNHKTI